MIGSNTWPIIRDYVDDVVLVSDAEIISAMRDIWERMKIVVEPSAAVATAAVLYSLELKAHIKTHELKNIVVVITGGNADLDHLPWQK